MSTPTDREGKSFAVSSDGGGQGGTTTYDSRPTAEEEGPWRGSQSVSPFPQQQGGGPLPPQTLYGPGSGDGRGGGSGSGGGFSTGGPPVQGGGGVPFVVTAGTMSLTGTPGPAEFEAHDALTKTSVSFSSYETYPTMANISYSGRPGGSRSLRICEAFQQGRCRAGEHCSDFHIVPELLGAFRQQLCDWLAAKEHEFHTSPPTRTFRVFCADLKEVVDVPIQTLGFTRGLFLDPSIREKRSKNRHAPSSFALIASQVPTACGLYAADPSSCKWGKWCNQAHVDSQWLLSRRGEFESWSAALEQDFQNLPSDHEFRVHDPDTRLVLCVPRAALTEYTRGLYQGTHQKSPSVCMLYQRGRCTARSRCNQVHVDPQWLALQRQGTAPPIAPPHALVGDIAGGYGDPNAMMGGQHQMQQYAPTSSMYPEPYGNMSAFNAGQAMEIDNSSSPPTTQISPGTIASAPSTLAGVAGGSSRSSSTTTGTQQQQQPSTTTKLNPMARVFVPGGGAPQQASGPLDTKKDEGAQQQQQPTSGHEEGPHQQATTGSASTPTSAFTGRMPIGPATGRGGMMKRAAIPTGVKKMRSIGSVEWDQLQDEEYHPSPHKQQPQRQQQETSPYRSPGLGQARGYNPHHGGRGNGNGGGMGMGMGMMPPPSPGMDDENYYARLTNVLADVQRSRTPLTPGQLPQRASPHLPMAGDSPSKARNQSNATPVNQGVNASPFFRTPVQTPNSARQFAMSGVEFQFGTQGGHFPDMDMLPSAMQLDDFAPPPPPPEY